MNTSPDNTMEDGYNANDSYNDNSKKYEMIIWFILYVDGKKMGKSKILIDTTTTSMKPIDIDTIKKSVKDVFSVTLKNIDAPMLKVYSSNNTVNTNTNTTSCSNSSSVTDRHSNNHDTTTGSLLLLDDDANYDRYKHGGSKDNAIIVKHTTVWKEELNNFGLAMGMITFFYLVFTLLYGMSSSLLGLIFS